jgi:hypothetical protein
MTGMAEAGWNGEAARFADCELATDEVSSASKVTVTVDTGAI